MTPHTYSLVSVSTRSDKRGVEVTFANPWQRFTRHYSFFPSFFHPHTSTIDLEKLLSQLEVPRHQLLGHPHSTQITASTFEELKQIAHALYKHTGYYPSLIEPERQFLLLQNWRYFQSFDEKGNPAQGTFADTRLDEMAESTHATLEVLQKHNPTLANEILAKMSSAHELFIPYTHNPETPEEELEIILENFFFTQNRAKPKAQGNALDTHTWSIAERERAKQRVFQTPLEGEGKCACCKPLGSMEAHLHPGTLVETIATQDGVYIHTNQHTISQEYDSTHPFSNRREMHAREWGLRVKPIGPLARGESIRLPLEEALPAQKQGIVRIHLSEDATWACKQTPLLLTKLQRTLEERATLHHAQETLLVQPYLQQYQLAFAKYSQTNPSVQFHHASLKRVQALQKGLAWHLVQGNTAWRGEAFARLLAHSLP